MGMDGNGIMPVFDINNNDGRRDGDMMDGGGWMWVMMLFFLLAWGGGGFGGNRNGESLTRAELSDGFNFSNIDSGIRGLQNGLCDGFYAQNTTMLQGFNGVQRDLCSGFGTVNQNINQARFDAQQCCCETNRNIDSLRFQSEKNTCDIVNAIKADGDATRALITQNTIQELRDNLQAAQLQLGNVAQTQNLINELRPCAKPAYITCSPYEARNCGCGC